MCGKIRIGYCALEYRPQGEYTLSPDESRVIAIVSVFKEGRAIVRVHPQWRNIVPTSEHEYLEELFNELKNRADVAPADLMARLSAMNVGPIVTRDAGQRLEDNPALSRLLESFQEP